eukprot:GFYU01017069.1.p1 GENE.GFYU01017069.1~~GFYU01017069.1.p1  ORF type:complete len:485 (-),score=129.96 GFYU01017069.1:145-1536(-)
MYRVWVVFDIQTLTVQQQYFVATDFALEASWTDRQEAEVTKFLKALYDVRNIIDLNSQYNTVNGVNIILLLVRTLKLFRFQPRMAILTKTLARAATDLFHFAVLFGIVLTGYAAIGNLVFGHQLAIFVTFEASVKTCMVVLLTGDGGVINGMIPAASKFEAVLFFWTYVFVVFWILMNIFLAIVIDAFAEVKQNATESETLPSEFATVVTNMFAHWAKLGRKLFLAEPYLSDKALAKKINKRLHGYEDYGEEEELYHEKDRRMYVGDQAEVEWTEEEVCNVIERLGISLARSESKAHRRQSFDARDDAKELGTQIFHRYSETKREEEVTQQEKIRILKAQAALQQEDNFTDTREELFALTLKAKRVKSILTHIKAGGKGPIPGMPGAASSSGFNHGPGPLSPRGDNNDGTGHLIDLGSPGAGASAQSPPGSPFSDRSELSNYNDAHSELMRMQRRSIRKSRLK